jgi:predicted transcriptional regulator
MIEWFLDLGEILRSKTGKSTEIKFHSIFYDHNNNYKIHRIYCEIIINTNFIIKQFSSMID